MADMEITRDDGVEDKEALHHLLMLKRLDHLSATNRGFRLQCLAARRAVFIPGGQWESNYEAPYTNNPKPEVNKILPIINRILSEYRNQRISPQYIATNSENSEFGDTLTDMYRAMEQDSNAVHAYDNAFQDGITGGCGAWKLDYSYKNVKGGKRSNEKTIQLESIVDADKNVYWDYRAKTPDKRDAMYAFILHEISNEEYEELYGVNVEEAVKEYGERRKKQKSELVEKERKGGYRKMIEAVGTTSSSRGVTDANTLRFYDWYRENTVTIAEYYEVVEKDIYTHVYTGLDKSVKQIRGINHSKKGDKERFNEEVQDAKDRGYTLTEKVKTRVRKVKKYFIDGIGILEDCGEQPGEEIPIIMYYANWAYIDGSERFFGLGVSMMDMNRTYNVAYQNLILMMAQYPWKKLLLTPEQVKGHERMWADDPQKNYAYLLINSIKDANGNFVNQGPLGTTQSPDIPPALATLLQILTLDMQEVSGSSQKVDEVKQNISGKALQIAGNRVDSQAFKYISGMADAMRRSGLVFLGMARDLYTESNREVSLVSEEGITSYDKINVKELDKNTGDVKIGKDITEASFNVRVDVAPSSINQNDATIRTLGELLPIVGDPATQSILVSLILSKLNAPGLSDIKKYYHDKLLVMGAVRAKTPEEQESVRVAKENEKPDPQGLFLEAEAKAAEVKAELDKATIPVKQAEALLKLAQAITEKSKATETDMKVVLGLNEAVSGNQKAPTTQAQK